MSWFSNFVHAALGAVMGQETPTPIVESPTTPIEIAVNQAGAAASTALSAATTTVKQEATSTVQGFLVNSVGAVPAEFVDSALEGLAVTALSKMSSSSNKTEADIANLVGDLVTSLKTPAAAAA